MLRKKLFCVFPPFSVAWARQTLVRRGQLLLATSGSTLLGAAHLVMQPRAASHEGGWDGDGPSAYRGFLSDIFVAPAAKGTLELTATSGKVWIGGMLLSEHPWMIVTARGSHKSD